MDDTGATHRSFLRHARFRDLHVAVGLSIAAILLYLWHDPLEGPNGGTWLGYTLGGAGVFIIVLLSLLGVRKRKYRSRLGTVKGWLSAHVYLGLSLLIVATLHTGFQFGWNVHTLAYALMVLVIVSGIYGIVVYNRYPTDITGARAEATREQWISEIFDLNDQALKLGDEISPEVHRVVARSCERLRIGGPLRKQLFGIPPPRGTALRELRQALQQKREKAETAAPRFDQTSQGTVAFMASQVLKQDRTAPEIEKLQKLLSVLGKRNEVAIRVNKDITRHARMQIWLYIHVPLTVALLGALTAHVVSVFLYW